MTKARTENIDQFGLEYVKKVERETKETGGKVRWCEGGGYRVIGGQVAFGNHATEEDSKKPLFTTKYYKAIGKIVGQAWSAIEHYEKTSCGANEHMPAWQAFSLLQRHLFDEFRKDNPKFKEDVFRKSVNKS